MKKWTTGVDVGGRERKLPLVQDSFVGIRRERKVKEEEGRSFFAGKSTSTIRLSHKPTEQKVLANAAEVNTYVGRVGAAVAAVGTVAQREGMLLGLRRSGQQLRPWIEAPHSLIRAAIGVSSRPLPSTPSSPTPYLISSATTGARMALEIVETKVGIVGSGPAAHTAAIYCARAELQPVLLEGWLANGIAAGGQLTTTTDVENFPGFPEGVLGVELTDKFRAQSIRFGTKVYSETVSRVDFSSRPFRLYTDSKEIKAETVVIATGAVAKRLDFPGSGEVDGYWNRGISACAVCDGAAPIFRNKPLAVIGGGDSAMEEANFLTKYASIVYLIHRRDQFRASKIMQARALGNPKIEVIWNTGVVQASGNKRGLLASLKLENLKTGVVTDLEVSGLFFAIGHEPASKFLGGQVETDGDGYIVTVPGTTQTSVAGVFAAGDVQDKKYRQAITAAGTGCMAALEAEHFLQEHALQEVMTNTLDYAQTCHAPQEVRNIPTTATKPSVFRTCVMGFLFGFMGLGGIMWSSAKLHGYNSKLRLPFGVI